MAVLPALPFPSARRCRAIWLTASAMLTVPAAAQQVMTPATPSTRPPVDQPGEIESVMRPPGPGDAIDFESERLSYDEATKLVTASGGVVLSRGGYRLTAERVEYDRGTGRIEAIGGVIITDPTGNQAFGERIELNETLRDAAIANLLLVLNDGGRLAATEGEQKGDRYTLRRAVYTPCAVVNREGCAQQPVWQIKAVRVIYDRGRHRVSYRDATLELFGIPVFYLPGFSHADGEAKQLSGLLVPGVTIQRQLGLGISLPVHIAQAPDRDFTLTPWLYSGTNPALAFQARRLLRDGPIQVDGMFTYARRFDVDAAGVETDLGNRFRGYLGVRGRLQHNPEWRSVFSVRLTTDDTFNRLYALSFDDVLRSTYALERVGPESFLSISAWAFQGLRATDRAGELPFVLPLIDWDWRPRTPVLGGQVRLGANTMNLFRTGGQDVTRITGFGRWDRSFITGLGQRITATGLLRADLYNVDNAALATLPEYAGRDGVRARGIAVAALDVEWPFSGPALGGTQTITPRVQFVAVPKTGNGGFANEDSRAIELEDLSLFDLNRFPGQDRFEGGARITYGLEYALDRPGWQLRAEFGQSVRVSDDGNDFPEGTGLSSRVSDFVGRTTLKVGTLVELTHRFRLDKDSLSVRRNEIDLTIGGRRTYASLGYIRLNRNVTLEDLEDREELRAAGRIAIAQYWTAYGTGIIDLTKAADNPLSVGDGFSPIRHRVGVEYEDECLRFGLSWRRDYVGDRDFRPGNTFLLTLVFKSLGAR